MEAEKRKDKNNALYVGREIKFRVWHIEEQLMYETLSSLTWTVAYCEWHGTGVGRGYCWINPIFKKWSGEPKKQDSVLMQWTGIKDWYEGDILALDDEEDKSKCVIIFVDGCFKRSYIPFLTAEQKADNDYYEKDFVHCIDNLDLEMWHVIGNIYKDTDLLIRP